MLYSPEKEKLVENGRSCVPQPENEYFLIITEYKNN